MIVVISDDNFEFCSTVADIVQDFGYETHLVHTPEDTIAYIDKFHKKIGVLLLDIEFGPDTTKNGMDVLEYCRTNHPFLPVVMITGKGTIETAVKATKLGAINFVEKSLVSKDTIKKVLESALSKTQGKDRKEIIEFLNRNGIIGSSDAIVNVGYSIVRFARTDLNVLITGETGTGKKLVAFAIHNASNRARKPFVTVDIPNIKNELFQAELFGRTRGAYTGADSTQDGLFQRANGGTLFLDEIGELSIEMQAALLNPIQDKIIRKVGSNEPEEVDIRFISATDKDLATMVREHKFRDQLYHRLRECEIYIPPLRERKEDIPEILEYYVNRLNRESGKAKFFSPAAVDYLQSLEWLGNVRELINTIKTVFNAVERDIIEIPDLKRWETTKTTATVYPTEGISSTGPIKEDLEKVEKLKIEKALEECNGNVSKTAAKLGVSRETLHNKIRKYGIDPNIYRKK